METPALDQLMMAYFHEDWDVEGSEDDVVRHFFRDEPHSMLRIADEIESVLATCHDETETESYIRALRPGYNPTKKFGGYRAWLDAIAQRARADATPTAG